VRWALRASLQVPGQGSIFVITQLGRGEPPDGACPSDAVHQQDVCCTEPARQEVVATAIRELVQQNAEYRLEVLPGVRHCLGDAPKILPQRLVFAVDPKALCIQLRLYAAHELLVSPSLRRPCWWNQYRTLWGFKGATETGSVSSVAGDDGEVS
jgi:hypothetical protein